MADRIDIDALLIGALYGELTPADEARLTVHLESHPADRNALDDLTRIRAAVRDSRVLDFQFEPPQAISALLLQEASRRAPRSLTATARTAHARDVERESWFQRFVRSFMAHPAMAAAAMLVLVVGVAGTLYLSGTDQFAPPPALSVTPERAEQAAAAPAADRLEREQHARLQAEEARTTTVDSVDGVGAGAPGAPPPAVPAPPHADRSLDSRARFRMDGPMDARKDAPRRDDPYGRFAAKPEADVATNTQLAKPAKADDTRVRALKAKKLGGIELRTPQLSPKELKDEDELQVGAAGRGAPPRPPPAATAPAAPSPARGFESAPAPEPAVDAKRAPSGDPAAGADKSASSEAKPVDDRARTLEWARKQRDQVVSLVSSSRCQEAAATANEIYSRAPDYYAANIVTDRLIKPCLAYVNRERELTDRKRAAAKNAIEAPAQAAPSRK